MFHSLLCGESSAEKLCAEGSLQSIKAFDFMLVSSYKTALNDDVSSRFERTGQDAP